MKCNRCGTENPEGTRFCPICGNKLEEQKTKEIVPEQNEENINNKAGVFKRKNNYSNPIHSSINVKEWILKHKKLAGGIAAVIIVLFILFSTNVICIHSWQEATCTKPMECAKCHRTKGEALGHQWSNATCTEPKTCETCGLTEGEALGHSWKEATCTEPKTCETCGLTNGDPLGHKAEKWTTTKKPTCTEKGEKKGTCSRCHESVTTDIKELGHDWNKWTTTRKATCKRVGKRQRQCKRCGKKKTRTVAKTKHKKGKWKTKEESYVDSDGSIIPGTKVLKCAVCGKRIKTKEYSIKATVSQINAVKKAWDYIYYQGFSRTGLINQLEYEGFSTADATFGVDQCDPDWNYQAERAAKSYMDYTSFSRAGLIDQLMYEGFTQAQAEHGASSVGL